MSALARALKTSLKANYILIKIPGAHKSGGVRAIPVPDYVNNITHSTTKVKQKRYIYAHTKYIFHL